MADNEIVSKIAQSIRAIRLKKNLTIQQLAEKTRLSKGLLSKIENSRTTPSLPVFVQILESLEISFRDFFQEIALRTQQKYLLIRKDEVLVSAMEQHPGVECRMIMERMVPASTIAISVIGIKPSSNVEARLPSFNSRLDYVISGNCEYDMGNDEIVRVEAGDSLFLNGGVSEFVVRTAQNEALMLVVNFSFEPRPHSQMSLNQG